MVGTRRSSWPAWNLCAAHSSRMCSPAGFRLDRTRSPLGRVAARQLDVAIGDQLELTGEETRARYEISGLVVPPLFKGSDEVGQGAVVTSAGYSLLDPGGSGCRQRAFAFAPVRHADDVAGSDREGGRGGG